MYYFLFGALRAEEGKTQRAHEISHWIQKDEEEEVCQAVRMPTLFFFFGHPFEIQCQSEIVPLLIKTCCFKWVYD